MDVFAVSLLVGSVFVLISAVQLIILLSNIRIRRKTPFENVPSSKKVKTMIVAGSGGHTTEMLRLVGALGHAYWPRHYVVADTDHMSRVKIEALEKARPSNTCNYSISSVPRSREVAQSWVSTVFTTLRASLSSFPIVIKDRPDLILVNGPGTCIPICAAGFLLTVLGIQRVRIVYVESICRVQTLSLSGKILYYFADQILVQWPQLKDKYPLAQYIGKLI